MPALIGLTALGLILIACADAIPDQAPNTTQAADSTVNASCGWMRWTEDPIDLSDWFESHPETAALHWWDAQNGTFRSARGDSLQSAPFKSLRRVMTVWREPHGTTGPPTTFDTDQVGNLIELKRGMNLVRWYGDREPGTSVREAFHWIGSSVTSITRMDSLTNHCHHEFGAMFNEPKRLTARLGPGDLLAVELSRDATWTQSWLWQPTYASFGDVGLADHSELYEQVREVSGFVATRYGLAAESYVVMLLTETSAMASPYQALTRTEFDVSWWPDNACGVGWSGGVGLLIDCRDPVAFDHEYIHVIQQQLARGTHGSPWRTDPSWLIEGMAEYLAARYRDAILYEPYKDARRQAIALVSNAPEALSLAQLESTEEFRAIDPKLTYSLGMLAAEWLAAHVGDDALFEFQRQLSRAGHHWRFAFEIAFETTVEEFYEAFDEHSNEFASPRPHAIQGLVLDQDGQPVHNLKIHAYPSVGRSFGNDLTNKQGEFAIDLGAGSYRLMLFSETNCTVYGAYGEGGKLATWLEASLVIAGSGQEDQTVLRLPAPIEQLSGRSTCRQAEGSDSLRGRVLGHDGAVVKNVLVFACGESGCGRSITDESGVYAIDTPDKTVGLFVGPAHSGCEWWGLLGAEGSLVSLESDAPRIEVKRRTTGVDIRLPATLQELEAVDVCW
ncbi:MAG: hypothetical protein OXD50_08430 [Chloroflexi bacterium]|nr:hypothetical protein [Chloroflexota bacterium]